MTRKPIVEMYFAFAQPIRLPRDFDEECLVAMKEKLRNYEPTLFSRAAAAAPNGTGVPDGHDGLAERVRLASSVLQTDDATLDRCFEAPAQDFDGACDDLELAFVPAADKLLGEGHGLSIFLQNRIGAVHDDFLIDEFDNKHPAIAMYIVHDRSFVVPGNEIADATDWDGDGNGISVPGLWGSPSFEDIPVDMVNAKKTRDAMERLCRNLGLKKKGRAGWKVLVSAGERG